MPADRTFGQVEKRIRRMETTVQPDEYDQVLSDVGTLRIVDKTVMVQRWKDCAQKVLKCHKGFNITDAKLLSLVDPLQNKISFQSNSIACTQYKILKYKSLKSPLVLKLVKRTTHASEVKVRDVRNLLQEMGNTWDTVDNHKDYLKFCDLNVDDNVDFIFEDD